MEWMGCGEPRPSPTTSGSVRSDVELLSPLPELNMAWSMELQLRGGLNLVVKALAGTPVM